MSKEDKKEEKPKTESRKLQITFNTSLIEKMEKRAADIGLNLNQYFMYIVASDIEKNNFNKKESNFTLKE